VYPRLPVSLDCFCFVCLCLVYPILPVSLDCFWFFFFVFCTLCCQFLWIVFQDEEKQNKNNPEKLGR
jgi:hypothetical protein